MVIYADLWQRQIIYDAVAMALVWTGPVCLRHQTEWSPTYLKHHAASNLRQRLR